MEMKIQHKWQAEEYHNNSGVQQEAALHLLSLLKLKGNEKILDIGCGDGKITAFIAETLTDGIIWGSDISPEMIEFASKKFLPSKKNMKFFLQDGQEIHYPNQFDLIFSSFVLQWVLEINQFFQRAKISLKNSGRIGCTIPLSISGELEDALAYLISHPDWNSYFNGFELNYYLRNENIYEQILLENNFTPSHFEVVNQRWLFPSRKEFELYTLMWLPHLDVIPENFKKTFFNKLVDKYIENIPSSKNDEVSFTFARLDFIANNRI